MRSNNKNGKLFQEQFGFTTQRPMMDHWWTNVSKTFNTTQASVNFKSN